MQIIDNFGVSFQIFQQNILSVFLKAFENAFTTLVCRKIADPSKRIIIYCYLYTFQLSDKVLTEISYDQFCNMSINVTLANKFLLKCTSIEQKINTLRCFLKQNFHNRNMVIQVHPRNGHLNMRLQFNLSDLRLLKNQNYMVYLLENLQLLSDEIKNTLKLIKNILNDSTSLDNSQTSVSRKLGSTLNRKLKIYIKSSAHYAWKFMEQFTKSDQQNKNNYHQKKKIFRAFRKGMKVSHYNKILNDTTTEAINQIQPFFILKRDEDEQIGKNNLNFLKSFKHDEKIINEIQISESEFNRLKKNDIRKFTYKQKKISVAIDLTNQNLEIQKSILKKLPEIQFVGLPRYYIINNYSQETANYRITNLYDTIDLNNFLVKNNSILSNQSKILLVHKISNTLRYLRDNSVLYHNLHPANIKIKKGLIPKLVDFTNSYSQDIQLRSRKNIFPFVSNEINTIYTTQGNQKSDSYSLGMLMYHIFYGKYIHFINQSKLLSISQDQKFNRLNKKLIMGINRQKQSPCYQDKLILKFILDAISHEFIAIRSNQMKLYLKQRPYLDWFSIISKELNHKMIN